MPVNFLGEPKHPLKKITTPDIIELHRPAKEAKRIAQEQKKAAKAVAQKKPEIKPSVTLGEVNLVKSFQAYLLKRRLTFLALLVIIIIVAGSLIGYFLFIYKPAPKIVVNKPVIPPAPIINTNVNQIPAAPVCGNGKLEQGEECDDANQKNNDGCSTMCEIEIVPPPITPPPPPPVAVCGNGRVEIGEACDDGNIISNDGCDFSCQKDIALPVVLPDTELAPLRGALVKFAKQNIIYLVDNNGELREVDLQTVYFLDGQKISQVKPEFIYVLADQYESVRRGKIVRGKIEWDPRILSPAELQPFK